MAKKKNKHKNKKPKLSMRPSGDPKLKAEAEKREAAARESKRTLYMLGAACVLIVILAVIYYVVVYADFERPDFENAHKKKAASNQPGSGDNQPAGDPNGPRAVWAGIEAFMADQVASKLDEAAGAATFADNLPLGYGATAEQWAALGVSGFSSAAGSGDFRLEAGDAAGSWKLTYNSANTMGYAGTARPPTGTVTLTSDGTWTRTGAAETGD